MSHFSKINASISNDEALKAATTRMGFSLTPHGSCRYYFGHKRADMVIGLPGKYDVALMKEGDHYSVQADLFDGQVEQYIGANAELLMQRYAVENARIEAFKKALSVSETSDGDDIVLILTDFETGGQISLVCHLGGKIDLKTSGFPGESCMKFQDLEKALGNRVEFQPTMEMYEAEPVYREEHVSQSI